MGGTALNAQGKLTRRVSKDEYNIIEDNIIEILSKYFHNGIFKIPYYREKESFGDLDIIVVKPKLDRDIFIKMLFDEFGSEFHYFNSNVVSFDYKDFQIDLIFISDTDKITAVNYYSWNDINNLIGVIAKSFNLKHAHDGLKYVYRGDENSGYYKHEIIVSKDLKEIYTFLGFNYEIYEKGFDNLKQMFEFVCSTPYLNVDKFQFIELNAINRVRNKKRANYQGFLQYLNENNINQKFDITEIYNDNDLLIKIDKFFPKSKLIEQINSFNAEYKIIKLYHEKFNGKIVMKLYPNLTGKKLGEFIHYFNEFYSMNDILNLNDIEIENLIKKAYYFRYES